MTAQHTGEARPQSLSPPSREPSRLVPQPLQPNRPKAPRQAELEGSDAQHRRDPPPLIRRAMSRALALAGRPSSPEHRNFPGIPVDAHEGAVPDAFRPLAGSHDPGNAVLARYDRRMRKQPAIIGDDSAEEREQDVESLARGFGDEHIALGNPAELGWARHSPRRPFIDALACG